jgi:serine protease
MKKLLVAALFVCLWAGAASAGDIRVALNWRDNSNNENGFGIEQSATQDFAVFNQIGVTQQDVATFQTGALTPNQQYCYRVYAFNQVGNSSYSNVACVTTPSLPNGPSDLIINLVIAP